MVGVRLFGYLVVVGDGGFAYLVGCFVLSCIELLIVVVAVVVVVVVVVGVAVDSDD